MQRENISKLFHKQIIYRYFIPIQSSRQLLSAIVYLWLCAFGYYLMSKVFMWILGTADMPMLGAFIFALSMAYFALYTALPAHFKILVYAGETPHILGILDGELRALGYESANPEGNDRMHYRKKGAKRLFWTEEDFHITERNGEILVNGPLFANDKLRNLLVKSTQA